MVDELKVLSIGNSFSMDTMRRLGSVARGMGMKKVKLWNLYVPGCPVGWHYKHAMEDTPAYICYMNTGNGWSERPDFKISEALADDQWDWINIQHGSAGGGGYTDPAYYVKLPALVAYVKRLAPTAKISFNLT